MLFWKKWPFMNIFNVKSLSIFCSNKFWLNIWWLGSIIIEMILVTPQITDIIIFLNQFFSLIIRKLIDYLLTSDFWMILIDSLTSTYISNILCYIYLFIYFFLSKTICRCLLLYKRFTHQKKICHYFSRMFKIKMKKIVS